MGAFDMVKVNSNTIVKCFKTAKVLDNTINVTELIFEDPFADVDEAVPLVTLISSVMGSCACSELVYIESDNELCVCVNIDDDHWGRLYGWLNARRYL